MRRSNRLPLLAGLLAAVTIVGVTVPILHERAASGPVSEATAAACDVSGRLGSWSSSSRLTMSARAVSNGDVLVDHGAWQYSETASNMKLLTMTAAVETLGADTRIATRVYAGTEPGEVILVGGGDPTLSRLPSGQSSVYPDTAHLDTLADRVRSAWNADPALAATPITRVVADTSLFGGPAWEQSWPEGNRANGSMPYIGALMVDGDRDDPAVAFSARGDHPAQRAASAFAGLLGSGVETVVGETPERGALLGTVRSAPVGTLVRYALTESDNTLAETLGRLTAIARGAGTGFDALQSGTTGALADLGLDVSKLRLLDGSGLSPDDRVAPGFMTTLMLDIASRPELAPVYDGLPVAGKTGTLAEHGRFSGADSAARGHIRAKTGTLPDMIALTGITDARFGTRVVFTIWARGQVDATTRGRVDALAATVWQCGGLLRA